MAGLSESEREVLADVLAMADTHDRAPDVEGFGYRRSDQMQMQILAQEQAINNQQLGSVGASRDRRRAAMDNMQKLLDITRSMNPTI